MLCRRREKHLPSTFFIRFCNGVHEKNQHYFVIWKISWLLWRFLEGINSRDTSFCDAITIIYDEIVSKIFIIAPAKPYVKRGSDTPPRKTPSRNYIFPKNTWPKLHYPEYTFRWTCIFQKIHFPERALSRNYFPEHALARNYTFLNVHFPEITFSWTCICQKFH